MYKPLAVYIGLRYTAARRCSYFVSFISIVSILCFFLGVATLIAVLSVMNGFDETIRERVFSMAPQVTVSTFNNSLPDWQDLDRDITQLPQVVGSAPYIAGQGMFTAHGQAHAALIYGIDPGREDEVSQLSEMVVRGSLNDLKPGEFGIVLGQDLAAQLGVVLGDKVTLFTPTAATTPVGIIPRTKRFQVVGVFHAGNGFGFDNSFAYMALSDAQKLYRLDDNVSGIRLRLNNLYLAPMISFQLRQALPSYYVVSNWTEQYGAFFQAIALEKTMMFFILMLIILVAAFSLVSTLFMVVKDKEADIAILRTLGATPATIMGTFVVQGTVIGLVGTFLGLMGGIALAIYITDLAEWVQTYFQVQLLSSDIYYVDYLPSKLEWPDVIKVCGSAMLASIIVTLFPAWRASRIQPAEALSYE